MGEKFLAIITAISFISALHAREEIISDELLTTILKEAEKGEAAYEYLAGSALLMNADYKEAEKYFQKAALQGLPFAGSSLYSIYSNGLGVKADFKAAVKWSNFSAIYLQKYRKGDEVEELTAKMSRATEMMKPRTPEQAKTFFERIKKSATNGNKFAAMSLGRWYFEGVLTEKDTKQGLKWFQLAAKQGLYEAQRKLADIYFKGISVPQDRKEGIAALHIGATAGDPLSATELGLVLWSDGQGNVEEFPEASKWFAQAAEDGEVYAQNALSMMHFQGHGMEKNPKGAFQWAMRGANQGYAISQYWLSCFYEAGIGVEKSEANFLKWLQASAESGFAYAQLHLGELYKSGKQVKLDYKEAAKWLTCAKDEVPEAAFELSELYMKGKGVEQDTAKAKALLVKAAKGGFEPARTMLLRLEK